MAELTQLLMAREEELAFYRRHCAALEAKVRAAGCTCVHMCVCTVYGHRLACGNITMFVGGFESLNSPPTSCCIKVLKVRRTDSNASQRECGDLLPTPPADPPADGDAAGSQAGPPPSASDSATGVPSGATTGGGVLQRVAELYSAASLGPSSSREQELREQLGKLKVGSGCCNRPACLGTACAGGLMSSCSA